MKKIKLVQLSIVLAMCSVTLNAQERHMASAGKLFDKYAYVDAIASYEQIAEKGHKSAELFQKLGDANYYNGNLEQAAKWYGELFMLNEEVAPEYYYRYSQSLKSVGDYDKANAMLEQFSQKNGADLRAKLYTENKDYLTTIKKNSGRYEVRKTTINSAYSDYGPAYWNDKLVFASSRDTMGAVKRVDLWTNNSFTELYQVPLGINGIAGKPEKFSRKVDTRYHEATPAFTKDGNTMYFTRNNFNNGKVKKDDKGQILLKIYRATYKDDKWTDVTELPFNNNTYSIAHPALSPDEKTLYFASNMPGSFGESDIFKVSINDDGSFGTPENLGAGINTQGKETFPFIDAKNQLYFASDGHPGLGGLDIYVAKTDDNNVYSKAHNVGAPVNSNHDDFGFIINSNINTGFFTSNRAGGAGLDDIYGFKETKEIEFECKHLLAGVVTDEKTGEVFSNATVSLYDASMNFVAKITTSADGKYSFDVECGQSYTVKSEKEFYLPKEVTVTIPKQSGETQQPIAQVKPEKPLAVGTDLAKEYHIDQLYFDLGKYNIRPDAAVELEKIIAFMKEYPSAKIDVRTHTDCRASHKYNQTLSNNRAKSVIEYIVNSGIDASRLTGRGYGETKLVNKCADGVKCSEEEHQQNRRSEFIIVEI